MPSPNLTKKTDRLSITNGDSRMPKLYTFWRIPETPRIPDIIEEACPIGTANEVVDRLIEIPFLEMDLSTLHQLLQTDQTAQYRFIYSREDYVSSTLTAYGEGKNGNNGRIFFLGLTTTMTNKSLLSLYVQLRENFGVEMFNEQTSRFQTIKSLRG